MSTIHREKITDESAWSGPSIHNDRSWELHLDQATRDELDAALRQVKERGVTVQTMTRADFAAGPGIARLAEHIRESCRTGRGFTVVRNFPVKGYAEDDVRLMYWGLGKHLGTCVSQDIDCALVADVKEKGLARGPLTRAYGSKHETSLHVDATDIVGLLGVRQAKTGALSTLASSVTVFNEFVEHHPEWLPALFEGFHWDRKGEQAAWEAPISPHKMPIFTWSGKQLSARYNRSWITSASVRRNLPFTDDEKAMLDFFDAAARRHALTVEMKPGDVYFASNYTVLHGRHAYEEMPDTPQEDKRLFLRLWAYVPGFREFENEGVSRYGITNFGNMGWTSEELLQGKHLADGNRRSFQDAA